MNRRLFFAAVVGFGLFGLAEMGHAQMGGASVRNRTRNFLFNRPTVSPYLNLATRGTGGMSNYHTLVRPQVERQQQDAERSRQTVRMQQQLNRVQNEFRQSQQQTTGMMLTGRYGWSSRGMPRHGSTLNYFPGFGAIPRRR